MTTKLTKSSWRLAGCGALALLATSLGGAPATAEGVPQNDILNATLWAQTSVEYKANALAMYRLAGIMLNGVLENKSFTAAPAEQGASFHNKPPAVILDVDETVLDNSPYEAWVVKTDGHYSSKTWGPFVNSETSLAIPGSLEFIKGAAAKGVKIFYVSNRKAPLEKGTRNNLKALGYPIDESEDTVPLRGEKPEWKSSKKSPRRSHVAANYRVVMVFGDNFGDFVDGYKGSIADRQALYEKHDKLWGTGWFMLANPMYGSWESAAFGGNWKLSSDERRQMKLDAMASWPGP